MSSKLENEVKRMAEEICNELLDHKFIANNVNQNCIQLLLLCGILK